MAGNGAKAALHRLAMAQHAHVVPHRLRERVAQFVDAPRTPGERELGALDAPRNDAPVRVAPLAGFRNIGGHRVAGDSAEHRGVGHAVSAQAVGAVHPAAVFAGRIETRRSGRAVHVELDAAHQVVGRRHHFHLAARQVESAILAAVDHARERLGHLLRAKMAHLDIDPAHRPRAPGAHFGVDAPADHVARGPFAALVVVGHEALAVAVEQVAPGASQPFFEHRAGHPRVRPAEQAGRMELHHFHVSQLQSVSQRHGQTVAGLVAGGRVVAVHRRPRSRGQQHRLGLDEPIGAGPHVDEQDARDARTVGRGDQLDGAMLLEFIDVQSPYLLHQAVDDFDARQIRLVHSAVEALAGKRLGMQRAIGIAVEEAADLVFQLAYPFYRAFNQPPRQILARQPFSTFDGVHEVAFHRIARGQRNVVAALDHAGTAALAEQALHGDRHLQGRICLLGMQRREQAGAPGAQHQNVCLVVFDMHVRSLQR
ncbi:hypothetical protein D9M68_520160 [compost metagenome]